MQRILRTITVSSMLMACATAEAQFGGSQQPPSAQLGDADLSGDGIPDVLSVYETEVDLAAIAQSNIDCTCDIPRVNGFIEITSDDGSLVHCTITTTDPLARAGHSVSATADFNLDGHIDLLIGAPGQDAYGKVFLFHGPFTGGETRSTDDADIVFNAPHGIDHEFGSMTAPLVDMNGDGIAEVRIRSLRSPIMDQVWVTHAFDGSTGAYLATVKGDLVEDMWTPIKGDLDDDGDVDVNDQQNLISQMGRIEGDFQILADLDEQGSVTPNDLAEQVLASGEHPAVQGFRDAIETYSLESGDCDCPPEWPVHCCYYDLVDETMLCCDQFEPIPPTQCIMLNGQEDPQPEPACLAEDDCWQEFLNWITPKWQSCGLGAPQIYYVNCEYCDPGPIKGFYVNPSPDYTGGNEIYVCIDYPGFTCERLIGTLMEELLHALQQCRLGSPPPFGATPCNRLICRELQAKLLIHCGPSPTPCACARSIVDGYIKRRIAEASPTKKQDWEDCQDLWNGFWASPDSTDETTCKDILRTFCRNGNGIDFTGFPSCVGTGYGFTPPEFLPPDVPGRVR